MTEETRAQQPTDAELFDWFTYGNRTMASIAHMSQKKATKMVAEQRLNHAPPTFRDLPLSDLEIADVIQQFARGYGERITTGHGMDARATTEYEPPHTNVVPVNTREFQQISITDEESPEVQNPHIGSPASPAAKSSAQSSGAVSSEYPSP